jgi:hypothetical protein
LSAAGRNDDGGRSEIDRRFVLRALVAAGVAELPAQALADLLAPASPSEALLEELGRIETRAYSEEGIPMFLACEDLAAGGVPAGFAPTTLNKELAAAYRDYASVLPDLEREMTEYDAANLVAILALRDFESGGR